MQGFAPAAAREHATDATDTLPGVVPDTAIPDTFPRLLRLHARVRPALPAIREKDLGIWQTWTWAQVEEEVRALACGLAARGFRRGDRLAVIGDNRPRLYWAMLAAQSLGGVPVPLYQDAVAQEMAYAFADAGMTFALAENQEQVDKLLEILPECPQLSLIAFDDPRGMRHYGETQGMRGKQGTQGTARLISCERLQEEGRSFHAEHPEFFATEIGAGDGGDVAVMLYTSGTTGQPKAVCQTHRALIAAGKGGAAVDRLGPGDEVLSYLPPAWVGDNLFSYAQALVAGFTINCPESPETVTGDMHEIGPTYYFAPPRVFENLLTQVTIRMEDAGWVKRKLFAHFMALARRCGTDILDRPAAVPLPTRLHYALGDLLIYGPLRNTLGMSRIRVAITAGAAIGPDLFRFYRSIGVNLKQFYGSTETCAYGCMQPDGQVKFDTVGPPSPGVTLRIAENGEVLLKSPTLLHSYYNRPEETAAARNRDGYFHTGDAGLIDADGHLKIIDRAKDVGKLGDGSLFAPNYIENKLKFFPYIKEAVAFGDGRKQVCAFVNIDLPAVGDWAERRGLGYAGYTDLAGRPEVYDLVRQCVEQANAELAADATLAGAQVHRFLVLHKELDPDDDELTRTRKVRRKFIAEKYRLLVEALYSEKNEQRITTQVKFEDGRSGEITADVRIREAKVFPAGEVDSQTISRKAA